MIVSQEQVSEHANQILKELTEFCLDEFQLHHEWLPRLQLNFSRAFIISNGGLDENSQPIMQIAARRFMFPVTGHIEYPAFRTSTTIGAFLSQDWKLLLRVIMAHEIAHCVQFTIALFDRSLNQRTLAHSHIDGLGKIELNHGAFFQRIYRIIRRQMVNHLILPASKGISPLESSVAPDSICRIKRDTTHPMVHQSFNHPKLGPCVVTDHRVNGRKYKFTIQQLMTRQIYKISTERLILFGCKINKI